MKTPTLEEVKERYKDAEIVECLYTKEKYNITNSMIRSDREGYFEAWFEEKSDYCRLYKNLEYAKILTYKKIMKHNFPKDKTIVCNEKHTFEQHKKIMKLCIDYEVPVFSETWDFNNNPELEFLIWDGESVFKCNERHKKDYSVSLSEFKAFIRGEGKLDYDKKFTGWKTHSNGWLGCFYKGMLKFGIGFDGSFFIEAIETELEKCCYERDATTEEVTEALKKEALKRYSGKIVKAFNLHLMRDFEGIGVELDFKESLLDNENTLWISSGKWNAIVMENGIWAEIVDPVKKMTIDEIASALANKLTFKDIMYNYLKSTTKERLEEILGYKIEIVK